MFVAERREPPGANQRTHSKYRAARAAPLQSMWHWADAPGYFLSSLRDDTWGKDKVLRHQLRSKSPTTQQRDYDYE